MSLANVRRLVELELLEADVAVNEDDIAIVLLTLLNNHLLVDLEEDPASYRERVREARRRALREVVGE